MPSHIPPTGIDLAGAGTVRVGDGVLHQAVSEEVVLLNLTNQQYYGLDKVGAEMWRLILEGKDAASIARHLCTVYNVDEQTVLADLHEFVGVLIGSGLLKPSQSQSAG